MTSAVPRKPLDIHRSFIWQSQQTVYAERDRPPAQRHLHRVLEVGEVAISEGNDVGRHRRCGVKFGDLPSSTLFRWEECLQICGNVLASVHDLFRYSRHIVDVDRICARDHRQSEDRLESWLIPARKDFARGRGLKMTDCVRFS